MSGIELPHLETFCRAAECGSFTAAAEGLGVTQAAVSQRIGLLERDLGTGLFERHAGRIGLTEAGRQLYEYAQRILQMHEEARTKLSGFRPHPSGELALATSSIPGEHILPAILSEFRERFPEVHVRATVADSDSVLRDVQNGRAPMGLLGRKADLPHLEFRPLATDHLVLIVPPGHAWGKRRSISLDELRREPLVLREAGSGSRWNLEKGLERAGVSVCDLTIALELGSNVAIKDAVRRGLGPAFLSQLAVEQELEEETFHSVRVKGLDTERHFYAVYDRRKPLPLTARLFLHFLQSRKSG